MTTQDITSSVLVFILMGVTGSGKTTIGTDLAQHIGAEFIDADDYHPEANKEKMQAGIPLTDADRWPWLAKLNQMLLAHVTAGQTCVLACSALKESYRDLLEQGLPPTQVRFVFLEATRELLEIRLAHRHHEFMNSNLLSSQLATLEEPEDAIRISNDRSPDEVVQEILDATSGATSNMAAAPRQAGGKEGQSGT